LTPRSLIENPTKERTVLRSSGEDVTGLRPAVEASFWLLKRLGLADPSSLRVDLGDEPAD
jgi:hypothetical protein